MLGVDHRDTLHEHVLRVGDLHATQGIGEYTATDDAHVLGAVDTELGPHHSPRRQVDGGIARYLDLAAGQVLGLVYAGAEVDEAGILDEYVVVVLARPVDAVLLGAGVDLRLGQLGEEVQVVLAVAPKLDAQVLRAVEGELYGTLIDPSVG